ncbi:efflux RND transporter periplasmic adaptor subunit [Calditerrivibrio sp.]|uniref:efflux RND transporter periplasmic adaptor subunit n=1 Tax=Calditerrivibrio sp. TaxID=2792612 RepID=UPI003D0D2070
MNRLLFYILLLLILITACSQDKKDIKQKSKQDKPVAVVIETVKKTDIPVVYETFGQVVAKNSISLTSKVSGKIEKIFFNEGDFVKKRQLLVKIDCLTLEKSIKQAEAILQKDLAILENAKKNASRYEELVQKGYAAQVDLDNAQTSLNTALATVEADKANIEYLKSQISYCTIKSPINGKAGEILLDQGNYIKENDKAITTIYQITPIDAEFSLPEEYLDKINQYLIGNKKIIVELFSQKGEKIEDGFISFIDNTIDRTSGSFKLKATFKNSLARLWPGEFVNVKVYFDTLKDVYVVPLNAIQKGQDNEFVWIISDNNTASIRNIHQKYVYKEIAVVDNLNEGEKVVTDGAIKLRPNAKVEIRVKKNNE